MEAASFCTSGSACWKALTSSVCSAENTDLIWFCVLCAIFTAAMAAKPGASSSCRCIDSSLLVTFERSADAEDALVKGDANLVSRARALGDLVHIDESVIPARVTWVGGEVGEAPDIGQIERNLVELSGHKTAILKAIGQRDAYLSTLAAAKLRLEEVQNQVQALSPLSKEALEQVEADYLLKAQRVREVEDSIANIDKAAGHVFDVGCVLCVDSVAADPLPPACSFVYVISFDPDAEPQTGTCAFMPEDIAR